MTPATAAHAKTAPEGREASSRRRAITGMDVSISRSLHSADQETGVITPQDRRWPARVRRMGRAGLHYWGLDHLTEPTELLLTELVTNALLHGDGPDVGVRIYATSTDLRIEVKDGSPESPVLRRAALLDEDGRGLFLVATVADAWGVSDDGTVTWCSLTLDIGTSSP